MSKRTSLLATFSLHINNLIKTCYNSACTKLKNNGRTVSQKGENKT